MTQSNGQAQYSKTANGLPKVEVWTSNGAAQPPAVDASPAPGTSTRMFDYRAPSAKRAPASKKFCSRLYTFFGAVVDTLLLLVTCRCCTCCPCIKKENETVRRVVPHNRPLSESISRHEIPNRNFAGNQIKTTKYSLLSFLPKNLFEQFHRFANLYFIFIVVLNFVPQIEAFAKELSMIPILFVIGVTAVKDAFEDFRRYRSDQKINASTCRVWDVNDKKYVKTRWKDVRVGDFVHLSSMEIIPADILLVKSTDAQGICYVETSNLDGESNLKQRTVVTAMKDKQHYMEIAPHFTPMVECELPNSHIYKFHGSLLFPDGSRESIGKNNLLLRGCEIRNTDFVEGIVVYAGAETKSMKNNSGPRYKRSELERLMNWDVVWCVVLLLVLCVIGAVGSGMWLSSFDDPKQVIYLPFAAANEDIKPELEAFVNFWSYIIILQVMIPISLYVSIEIIKLGQIFFIMQDKELYHEGTDKRIQCRALNIPEELGQISYVMSDKTGTLTENKMIFRRCAIAGHDFGPSDASEVMQIDGGKLDDELRAIDPLLTAINELMRDESQADTVQGQALLNFFINMAICNTVVVNANAHKDVLDASGNFSGSGFIPGPLSAEATGDTLSASTLLVPQRLPPVRTHIQDTTITELDEPTPRLHGPHREMTLLSVDTTLAGPPSEGTFLSRSSNQSLPSDLSNLDPLNNNNNNNTSTTEEDNDNNANAKNKNQLSPRGKLRRPMTLTSLSSFATKVKSKLSPRGEFDRAVTPVPLNPIYEAESPDELALVQAARIHGFRLLKRHLHYVMVELPDGTRQRFELLQTLPFDSVRKRMSVIVRTHDNRIVLFCKGADSVMLGLLSDKFRDSHIGQTFIFKSQEHLNKYSSFGLRTLCLAKKTLSEKEYERWNLVHSLADNSIDNREQLIYESAITIETDLELLGVTAIEDKLQDGVPETIESLRRAGVKVWVLTGDKLETAINIAFACKLFTQGMSLITITEKTASNVQTRINLELTKFEEEEARENEESTAFGRRKRPKYGLVVDGRPLAYCLEEDIVESFVRLVQKCTCVLICRATPGQKATVVKLVKEKLQGKTLAIGDGANDVAMIQAADVGVGISGQEGMQAVMASDYALPRFSFLKRLLLVHGHWCYDRLAKTILYFFYKNALFVFTLFWYQLFNGFSSQVVFDPWYLTFYNMVFTSLPPVLMGVFDQDASDQLLMDNPRLYSDGRLGKQYRAYSFWINMADALWQSMVIFFVSYLAFADSDMSMWEYGFVVFSALVYVNIAHFAVELKSWTWPMVLSVIVSPLLFVVFSLVYNALAGPRWMVPDPPYWVAQTLMVDPVYWLIVLFIILLSILPRMTVKIVSNSLHPSDVLLARLRQREKRRVESWSGCKPSFMNKNKQKVSVVDDDVSGANPVGSVPC